MAISGDSSPARMAAVAATVDRIDGLVVAADDDVIGRKPCFVVEWQRLHIGIFTAAFFGLSHDIGPVSDETRGESTGSPRGSDRLVDAQQEPEEDGCHPGAWKRGPDVSDRLRSTHTIARPVGMLRSRCHTRRDFAL
jgi:hypothetical protein